MNVCISHNLDMSSLNDQTLRWSLFLYAPQQRNINHFDNATHHSSVPNFPLKCTSFTTHLLYPLPTIYEFLG